MLGAGGHRILAIPWLQGCLVLTDKEAKGGLEDLHEADSLASQVEVLDMAKCE